VRLDRIKPSTAAHRCPLVPVCGVAVSPLADSSLNGLIGSQVVGDLYRIYTVAQQDGIEFNLAYIPAGYEIVAQESFDKEAMKRLFQLGYEWARAGYPWQKLPPGLRERPEKRS
jgi:hypothetical protein